MRKREERQSHAGVLARSGGVCGAYVGPQLRHRDRRRWPQNEEGEGP